MSGDIRDGKPETGSTKALKLEADGWITTGTKSMR
jgi:hypothetical protein